MEFGSGMEDGAALPVPVVRANTCSPAFFLLNLPKNLSHGELRGSSMDVSVRGRKEVWQDWKRAQAITFVVCKFANRGTHQAAFATTAPLADWLLALGFVIHGIASQDVAAQFHEWEDSFHLAHEYRHCYYVTWHLRR